MDQNILSLNQITENLTKAEALLDEIAAIRQKKSIGQNVTPDKKQGDIHPNALSVSPNSRRRPASDNQVHRSFEGGSGHSDFAVPEDRSSVGTTDVALGRKIAAVNLPEPVLSPLQSMNDAATEFPVRVRHPGASQQRIQCHPNAVAKTATADLRQFARAEFQAVRQSRPAKQTLLPSASTSQTRKPGAIPQSVKFSIFSPHLLARYNREELYEKVWASTMQKVAKEYGISDVAIGKTCKKLAIPVPGRGYWNKQAANQPVEPRPPLPQLPPRT